MAEESFQERTEQASPRRIQEAREKGQIVRSRELSTGALLLASVAGFMVLGPQFYQSMAGMMREALQVPRASAFDATQMLETAAQPMYDAASGLFPLLLLLMLVALLAPMLVGGWNFSTQALVPDFARLNPGAGVKRMFSSQGLGEAAKAIVKVLAVGAVAAWAIWHERNAMMGLVTEPLQQAIGHAGDVLLWVFMMVASATALVVAIDVPFQYWSYHKNLRMTKEELRQEYKESDGDPHLKGRIRRLQTEAARKRMMSEIPSADVVVTNPTHYAVALKYQQNMRAPQVVAKGVNLVAANIRGVAELNGVPIIELPPLARAIYHHVELGEGIPSTLYTAVAEVLAYVYQLRTYRQQGGLAPQLPDDVSVPAELDPLGETT